MKKQYITPSTTTFLMQARHHLLAGSTGDINNVTVGSSEITDGNQFGSRRGGFWDDEEE